MSAYSHEAFLDFFSSNGAVLAKTVEGPERRHRVRTQVHWPVLFFRDGVPEPIESTTQNLSSSGFYCLSLQPFTAGEILFCTIRVPSHETSFSKGIRVLECRARVMRCEQAPAEGYFGIGCHIEDYRFVASHETTQP